MPVHQKGYNLPAVFSDILLFCAHTTLGVIPMQSIWQKTCSLPSFPPLPGNCATDVLIIGGGLTGLLCAYKLKQAGISCILVEANCIGGGTTGHTTAKITAQHGLLYDTLIRRFGVEQTAEYLRLNLQALEQYRTLCQGMDCDFEEKESIVYSLSHPERLETELRVLEQLHAPARFVQNLPLPFPTVGGICFSGQAQFHPLKFIRALAGGLPIYEHTAVQSFDGKRYHTNRGTITAEKTIAATHFPIFTKHGGYFLKQYQSRSYVLALKNAAVVDGMYLDEQEGGLSFRNAGPFLLMGGGAHRTGKPSRGWGELEALSRQYYPRSSMVARWAAQDCMTLDDVPYIGRYSRRTPDLFVATGFRKWGMTSSMVAAQLLCDQIGGKEPDSFGLFSPSRSVLHPQLFVNTFHAVSSLCTPTRPRCPHMGCALKWNPHERSWDCPCHGSRFAETGELLNDPATGPLKSAEKYHSCS